MITLNDKYTQKSGRVFMSSNQALVRLPLEQARRDRASGLKTAGYISGYRGSPIGVYDLALQQAESFLDENNIRFLPGLNEELAVSACRGAQQLSWFGRSEFEGLFSLWYGKGIGVDRACESLKLGNLEGASSKGGFLAIAGDDHGGKSSDSAHQSEHTLIAAMLPTLYPSNIEEILEFGLLGWQMSRYSGCYVALKCITDTLDLTGTVNLPDLNRIYNIPTDIKLPKEGLNLYQNRPPLVEEDFLVNKRLPAATAFARANGVDKAVINGKRRVLTIISSGKAYLDVCQALQDLGLDVTKCDRLGIRLYKVGLVWPLDKEKLIEFSSNSDAVLIVEEKRPVMEDQIARHLYSLNATERPVLSGKYDLSGSPLLPTTGELTVPHVRKAIKRILDQIGVTDKQINALTAAQDALEKKVILTGGSTSRPAFFCSGCPHNISTKLPDGSLAMGGIGCHGLAAVVMDRNTMQFMPMGHEGSPWVSVGPLVDRKHVFTNMGDGTYSHSGVLSIRAAVAAKSNITYKLLYNDAVAMTGGQPVEQNISPTDMVSQLLSEGVRNVRLVSDKPEQYKHWTKPKNTSVHHRDELDTIQRELREVEGVTAIVYEQTCAAEKRRRRKRKLMDDPDKRVFINPAVCEGCGDCSVQSNCISVEPLETEFGRKRTINQSTCNKDFSCLNGFCPSFVTVEGAKIAVRSMGDQTVLDTLLDSLPSPETPVISDKGFNIMVGGIGGTGVLTVGALLGMAAHIEGKGSTILDVTGMAQKGGAVTSHIRLASSPDAIFTSRLSEGMTDLLIACDMVVGSGPPVLKTVNPGHTTVVINNDVSPTGDFQANKNIALDDELMRLEIVRAIDGGRDFNVDATRLSTDLTGNSIGTNILMMGYAVQKGLIPLTVASLEQAIRLNGTFVEGNLRTLKIGRLAAYDPAALERTITKEKNTVPLDTVEDVIRSRRSFLVKYQSDKYADSYESFVRFVQQNINDKNIVSGDKFIKNVALTLSKLMAYKDEYEIARLYTDPKFTEELNKQFSGNYKISVNLYPPIIPGRDSQGRPKKRVFGKWFFILFRIMKSFKVLRGTTLDPFGYNEERKMERRLITEYRALISNILDQVTPKNIDIASDIAIAASEIKGYGPIKDNSVIAYNAALNELMPKFSET